MHGVSPCSLPALPTHPGCGVRASIGQGKGMVWAGSGPPLSSEGWGGLVLMVEERGAAALEWEKSKKVVR